MDIQIDSDFQNHVYIKTWKLFNITYLSSEFGGEYRTLYVDKMFFDNLNDSHFKQSTVGKSKQEIIDVNVRSSKILKSSNISINNKEYINLKIVKLLQKHLNCKVSYSLKLLKYDQGDHFNEFHYDTLNKNNVATMLIFPPKKFTPDYTGGDLVFKLPDSDNEFRVEPSQFNSDDYTIIIFNDILHKCEPVLSGTRYVFKTIIEASFPNILDTSLSFKLSDVNLIDGKINDEKIKRINEVRIRENLKKKEGIKSKMIKFYTKLTDNILESIESTESKSNEFNDKMILPDYYDMCDNTGQMFRELKHDLHTFIGSYSNSSQIQQFDSTEKESIIKYMTSKYKLSDHKYNVSVLDTYIEDCKDLTTYSSSIIYYIKYLLENNYNVTSIQLKFNCSIPFDEGWFRVYANGLDEFAFCDSGEHNNTYNLIYTENDVKNGKHLDHSSEYNDESGYNVYDEYECTCLVIWK
jgi:hypothetical protein